MISSGELHGQTLVLDGPERTVGRAAGNDLRLEDPYISRHHAVLRRAGGAVLVEDAGSTAGVYVNGQRIDGPALLRPGDVIRIGRTDLQLSSPGGAAAPPEPTRAGTTGQEPPGGAGARFEVGAQRADVISNVARDQISYNQYALKFAPLRRRARALIRLGVVFVLGGFAIDLLGFVRYLSVFREWINLLFSSGEVSPEQAGEVFSRLVSSAFPFFVAGMAIILAGIACIVTGLLMRRRAREATR
ncbi:MAG TPA: FHA domain-containing protein [Actinomycetes bacterium]|nr:FHA domain-containing protein [Actinomycetes bacterium]